MHLRTAQHNVNGARQDARYSLPGARNVCPCIGLPPRRPADHYLNQPSVRDVVKDAPSAIDRIVNGVAAAVTASVLLASPAVAADSIVRLPASGDPQVLAAQTTMVEAWSIVRESFVDEHFGGHNWEEELRQHMVAAYNSSNPTTAWKEIGAMLSDLGDPYTRIMPAEEYAQFKVASDGELQGVGLLIANEPVHGHLLVLAPIRGGPAERAGVQPGDEVLSIDGRSMEGWTGEMAAKVLRGQGGTEVRVKLARRSDQIPGVPGRPEAPLRVQYREVSLRRERVALSPLYFTALHDSQQDVDVGYIRLTSFSSNAAAEMRRAIQALQSHGVSSFILDLRDNPGGLVRAGMDVARLWLDGSPTVFHVTSRDEAMVQTVALDSGEAAGLASEPLVVLVNGGSASASEILSGALHDNARAQLVGDAHTYGKGKIQSVFELQDGSALFVTVAKYRTPAGVDIDRRGIQPDSACTPRGPVLVPGQEAGKYLAGLPYESDSALALQQQLASDRCVLKAEQLLRQQLQQGVKAAPPVHVATKGML